MRLSVFQDFFAQPGIRTSGSSIGQRSSPCIPVPSCGPTQVARQQRAHFGLAPSLLLLSGNPFAQTLLVRLFKDCFIHLSPQGRLAQPRPRAASSRA
eukprot:9847194-Alexandrium_andersonii.AAC.1